jgi:arabinofuranan 3-O-arabinosyltransferase
MASTPSLFRSRVGRYGPFGLLAFLAFIPPLRTAPGVLAADTKHYLTANPTRLLHTAASMWDAQQFGGFVTHQTIGYLWPLGPYFWLCERLGIPDWVAQRLWLGLLFFAAGTGVLRLARRFGLDGSAALAAAVVYQLSPYVVTYANRTSALLAPWAGLGWLLLFTMRAARERTWRWPAAIALVVLSVGSINATALVLLAAGPLLWLAFAIHRRDVVLQAAVGAVVRTGLLTALTSIWWIVGLAFEGRYGADLLAYSETVQAVASTSTAAEVQRGLGYWLFYGGNASGRWNSASTGYLASPGLILLGFSLFAIAVTGLAVIRHRERASLGMLWLVGTVIAVGAYPVGHPTLYGRLLTRTNTITLALRSSTRATPLVALVAALSVGLLLQRIAPSISRTPVSRTSISRTSVSTTPISRTSVSKTKAWLPAALASIVMLAAALNLPALWNGTLVDRVLRRPTSLPAPWHALAADLNRNTAGGRVLELPGQEFGAFRWGTTTDQPLPAITTRPTITRDLLPLGDAQRMDLLYALDDRLQNGVLDRRSLAPVARLLGVGDIVLRNDEAFERYGTPSPDEVGTLAATGLSAPVEYPAGSPQLVRYHVTGTPAAVRLMRDRFVLVAGSGDGLVDAAAAGLIDGTELVRYAADAADQSELTEWVRDASQVIVTDSNRRRAHQWRGSQDVVGFTEDDDTTLLRRDTADSRLPVFTTNNATTQTVGDHIGGSVRATSYGPATAYWPEQRPVFAFDGDPTTTWMVGADSSIEDERIEARFDQPVVVDGMTIRQPVGTRQLGSVRVTLDDRVVDVAIDERSTNAVGQPVAIPGAPSRLVSIRIMGAVPGRLSNYFGQPAVGLTVALPNGEYVDEVVRVPDAATGTPNAATSYVFNRERVRKQDRVDAFPGAAAQPSKRRDPESEIVRSFQVAGPATFAVRGTIEEPRPSVLTRGPCRDDLLTLDGVALAARVDGTSFVACTPVVLAAGRHLLRAPMGSGVNQVVLTSGTPAAVEPASAFLSVQRESSTVQRVDLAAVSEATWLVVDDGWNAGWHASANGRDLGPPVRVNGGSMAWRLEPTSEPIRVAIEWQPQKTQVLAIWISGLGAALSVLLVARSRRTPPVHTPTAPDEHRAGPSWLMGAIVIAIAIVAASPIVTVAVCAVIATSRLTRRPRLVGVAAVLLAAATALYAASIQVRHRPGVGFGWVHAYSKVHHLALTTVLLSAAAAVGDRYHQSVYDPSAAGAEPRRALLPEIPDL